MKPFRTVAVRRSVVVTRGVVLAVITMMMGAACHHGASRRGPAVSGPGDTRPVDTPPEGTWKAPGSSSDMGSDIATQPGNGGLTESEISQSQEDSPLADIPFDYDSATVSAAAQDMLKQHAGWLKNKAAARVAIEGHCDERGTAEYNLALGQQRARAVYDYLTSQGIPAARLSTVSFGKERPLDPGHDEKAWAKNRRVHFVVSR
jgi:peptidoglycan-associated lipoprotein